MTTKKLSIFFTLDTNGLAIFNMCGFHIEPFLAHTHTHTHTHTHIYTHTASRLATVQNQCYIHDGQIRTCVPPPTYMT